jgi:hypothetical protein
MRKDLTMSKKDDLKYYSHILINKTKRVGFFFLFLFIYFIMTLTLITNEINKTGFGIQFLSIVFVSIPILIYPSVEKWVYKPWQVKSQKYERHYRN